MVTVRLSLNVNPTPLLLYSSTLMIDTHCHIDDPQYQPLAEYLRTQYEGGVEAIIVPATTAASSKEVLELCSTLNSQLSTTLHSTLSTLNLLPTYPSVGLHPEEVGPDYSSQLDEIESLLSTLSAIGEIGLDYHFDTTYKEQQKEALRQQLSWAVEYDLPAILHVRDATEDALAILNEYTHSPRLRGVMHCWSGSEEVARQIIDMGLYLGIGGIITFKNCKLREHLNSIPLERLLLETDAPYMAPVPHRGERNESAWIRYVMEELSQVYHVPVSEIERITTANAQSLFFPL